MASSASNSPLRLDYIRDGDILGGDQAADLVQISQRLEEKQAALRILDLNLDSRSPMANSCSTSWAQSRSSSAS